jgi:hypothetical protein
LNSIIPNFGVLSNKRSFSKDVFYSIEGKSMAKQLKLALAIVIIRQKPVNMTLKEFISLLQLKYKAAYTENKMKIKRLENELLKVQQELFLLKNRESIEKFHITTQEIGDYNNKTLDNYIQSSLTSTSTEASLSDLCFKSFHDVSKNKQKYESHRNFLINLVKLKIIGKNFNINENTQMILNTLKEFLGQIKYFLFETSNIVDTMATSQSIPYEPYTQTSDNSIKHLYQCSYSYDCLIHSLQIFLNIFQVEWLYYLRSTLIDDILQFIDDIVRLILEYDNSKV